VKTLLLPGLIEPCAQAGPLMGEGAAGPPVALPSKEAAGEADEAKGAPPQPKELRDRPYGDTLVLFDVDGTLAVPAQKAPKEMVELLVRLRRDYGVGIVGAGDYQKQETQLGGPDLKDRLDFVFSENGVHAFKDKQQIHCKSIVEFLGPERWDAFQRQLDAILLEEREAAARLLEATRPGSALIDRGTFLECRTCTVNVCAIGRTPALSKAERAAFEEADREEGLRRRLLNRLVEQFGPTTEYRLQFSIGGQIGIDVCPCGWDKTFCLQFVSAEEFSTVHFFGDKTEEGGGDFELFTHPRTVGHSVNSPEDTMQQIKDLFLSPAPAA
jgi:phosphomannomutase